jgi:hypothetical protein
LSRKQATLELDEAAGARHRNRSDRDTGELVPRRSAADRRSKLVFIVRRLDATLIERSMRAFGLFHASPLEVDHV